MTRSTCYWPLGASTLPSLPKNWRNWLRLASLAGVISSVVVLPSFSSAPLPSAVASLGTQLQRQSRSYLVTQALPTSIQTGNQISLNGQIVSGYWQRRLDRIGIADSSLMQRLGVAMLNTANPAQQPVQWFSDAANNAVSLPTWLAGAHRYLDITELALRNNWQVSINGNVLQISMPTAQAQAVRAGKQPWGDRIVVDLNGPAAWQLTEQPGQFEITLQAGYQLPTASPLIARGGNRFTSVQVSGDSQKTTIRGAIDEASRPQISMLANPPRLVIDIRRDHVTPRDIQWAPGLRWQQQYVAVGGKTFPVFTLTLDLKQNLRLRPIWTNPNQIAGSTASLVSMAERWQAIAAINAGFFNRNNQLPLGAVRVDGRWVSGPILNRGAIAWRDTGEVAMGRLALQLNLTTDRGQSFPIKGINTGYVEAGIGLYTPDWGSTYTSILDNEVIVTVANNQVVGQMPTGNSGSATVPIPTGGYLLVVRAYSAAVSALAPGAQVAIAQSALPAQFSEYPNIMGGGPLLLQNRTVVLNAEAESFSRSFAQQAAPRSGIGKLADGRLILVAVHTQPGGRGPTLPEMAQLMLSLGCVDALNLDGGSSTSLYFLGGLINRDARTAARVSNGLAIFAQPEGSQ